MIPVDGSIINPLGITAFNAVQIRARKIPRTELVHRDNLVLL